MQAFTHTWQPPFRLYQAGRHAAHSDHYRHDTSSDSVANKRVLVKRAISGEGILYSHGRKHRVPAGSLFVIERPGPNLYCYEGQGAPWHFEFVSFTCQSSEPLLPENVLEHPILAAPDESLLAQSLQTLVDAYLAGAAQTYETTEMAYRFYLELMRQFTRPSNEKQVADRLRDMIEESYGEELLFNRIASDFNITPEGLCRCFKSAFGVTPGRYLQGVRIRHAQQLLGAGEAPIKEIAACCGFASANYFGRCFKRATGMTPASYRNNPTIQ